MSTKRYFRAFKAFEEECKEFAKTLNSRKARPEDFEDLDDVDQFYYSEEDTAWQHTGDSEWDEFMGSVFWNKEKGIWDVEVMEHA